MREVDKRYYKINKGGTERIFTNVYRVGDHYSAYEANKNGKAGKFLYSLSQKEIDGAVISNSMIFVEKPSDVVFRFYLVNASEYDNGNKETSGIWLDFPTGIKYIENAFEEIGLPPDAKQGQYFIDECQCILKSLNPLVNAHTDIYELAKTAEHLDNFDGFQMLKLDAVMQTPAKFNSLEEIREFTHNADYYNFEIDICDTTQLGIYCIYDSGVFEDLSCHYKDAINAEAFGKYIAEAEHGVFTEKGYLYPSGDEWNAVEMPFFRPNSLKPGIDDMLIDTTEIFAVDLDSFFRQTSGEYDFMFDDVARAQDRISGCLRSGDTKAVKGMIFGMIKEEHLDISEVQPYLNRVENFERMKGLSGKKTRTQEKTSIREQLNDGKTKQSDTPQEKNSKKNDLEV